MIKQRAGGHLVGAYSVVRWMCWFIGLLASSAVVGGQEGDSTGNLEERAAATLVEDIWGLRLDLPRAEPSAALQGLVVQAMGLSPEQEAELRHLRIDMAEDLQWLHDQSKRQALTEQGTLLRYRAVLEKYQSLKDSLLTDTQRALMQRAQKHLVRRPRKPFISPEFPLVQVLGLTKSQQAQGYALLDQQRQKLFALEESNAVLAEADLIYAMETMRQAFEGMLTPQQTQKLDAVRTAWQSHRQRQAALHHMLEAANNRSPSVEADAGPTPGAQGR